MKEIVVSNLSSIQPFKARPLVSIPGSRWSPPITSLEWSSISLARATTGVSYHFGWRAVVGGLICLGISIEKMTKSLKNIALSFAKNETDDLRRHQSARHHAYRYRLLLSVHRRQHYYLLSGQPPIILNNGASSKSSSADSLSTRNADISLSTSSVGRLLRCSS